MLKVKFKKTDKLKVYGEAAVYNNVFSPDFKSVSAYLRCVGSLFHR